MHCLETLEDRIAPATIVVTTTADSGGGSLREALSIADSDPKPDTITFDPSVFVEGATINITSSLTIASPVKIVGPGVDRLWIDGGDAVRVLNIGVPGNSKVEISGLTIANGKATGGSGGGISSTEALVLKNVAFISNESDATGGALALGSVGSSLLMENVTMVENLASIKGGAVFADTEGAIIIKNSFFTGNLAAQEGGGLYLRNSNLSKGIISLTGVTISGNSVMTGDGGGLSIRNESPAGSSLIKSSSFTGNFANDEGGGLLSIGSSPLKVESTVFSNNSAEITGAILDSSSALLTITNSTIANNESFTGGAGAIELTGNNQVSISKSTFNNNTSADGGGALLTGSPGLKLQISGSTFSGNSASTFGGALGLIFGDAVLKGNRFSANSAGTNGGAILFSGSTGLFDGLAFSGNRAGDDGGALFVNTTGSATLLKSSFAFNQAGSDGGALFSQQAATLTVKGGLFQSNTANDFGGALCLINNLDNLMVESSRFLANAAEDGGAVYLNTPMAASPATFLKNSAQQNSAFSEGGAFYLTGASLKSFSGNSLLNNSAAVSGSGGGIFATASGDITWVGGVVTGNAAAVGGGGIFNSGGNFTFSKGKLTGNLAPLNANSSGVTFV